MKFSVVIITKNRRELLKKCINSVKNAKNNSDVEIIVVEETDKELDINGVKHVKLSGKNLGYGVPRNVGAKVAKGDYVIYIDDDCIMDKNYFVRLKEDLRNLNADVITGGVIVEGYNFLSICQNALGIPNGALKRILKAKGKIIKTNLFSTCNCCIKKEILLKEKFWEIKRRGGEDYDLALRLVDKGKEVYFDPDLICYHKSTESLKGFMKKFYERGKNEINYFKVRLNFRSSFFKFLRTSLFIRFLIFVLIFNLSHFWGFCFLILWFLTFYFTNVLRAFPVFSYYQRIYLVFFYPFLKCLLDFSSESGRIKGLFERVEYVEGIDYSAYL